ncbi:MAG: DNA recombination protein RmuC [Pseudomonadota bacterium]
MDYITNITALNASIDGLSLLLGAGIGLLTGILLLLIAVIRNKGMKTQLLINQKHAQEKLDAQDGEIAILREKLDVANQDAVRFQEREEATKKQLKEHRENTNTLELKFENLANKIFEEKTNKFNMQSQESLNTLLSPLKEKLNDFQKKVDDSFGAQKAEQFSLKEQIKLFIEQSDQMKTQTENLANALRGNSKTQGDFGEMALEKIMENAGLKRDIHYTTQATGMGMKHVETGQTIKPDVVVHLPDNKHIIVDSKVSLTNYDRLLEIQETDNVLFEKELKSFLSSVRKHVTDLEKRRYQDTDQLGTPDFVLMFMPIEGAYMLALQKDPDLHQFAWDKGVVLVGTSTLFSTLRTVGSIWRLVDQNNNANEIAKQGGALYEKVVGFVEDMKKIGANLKTLEGNYDNAMTKLSEGRGNILKRSETMKTLGAKTSKSLPNELLDQEELIAPSNNNEDKAA